MQFWKSQMYGFAFEIEIEDYERILTQFESFLKSFLKNDKLSGLE